MNDPRQDPDYIEAMKNWNQELIKHQERNRRRKSRIWNFILKLNGPDFQRQVIRYIAENVDRSYNFKIVSKPVGEFQKEQDYSMLNGAWINQTCGPCEDDYSGTICIELWGDKYLKFNYEC